MRNSLEAHPHYINKHGEYMPEIRNWKWGPDGMEKEKAPAFASYPDLVTRDLVLAIIHPGGAIVKIGLSSGCLEKSARQKRSLK